MMGNGGAFLIQGNSLALPLADGSVDLIVTSPPYFALRSYTDGGEHYDGQIGSEATPAEFVAALLEVTRECVRVLKPSGSLWVNLGDSYMGSGGHNNKGIGAKEGRGPASYQWGRRGNGSDGNEAEWTEANAAWLAGVIDSDGSISVHVNKQKEGNAPSFVAWCRIGQMVPEAVHEAHRITGVGKVFQDSRGVWNWNASAQQARYVLERIWPYLRIKQRQALAACEMARTISDYRASGKRGVDRNEIAYRQSIREAVVGWNSGKPTGWGPPRLPVLPMPRYAKWRAKPKSLNGLPWRYAIGCVDDLGLILRAEVIWSKPNGLPESVTDRVRRSHEQWFHFTKEPRYFSAVDEVREQYDAPKATRSNPGQNADRNDGGGNPLNAVDSMNPLGKLPGSVRTVVTEPLILPDHLPQHFAAFPSEWPRWIVKGWSPSGICVECGEGRTPTVDKHVGRDHPWERPMNRTRGVVSGGEPSGIDVTRTITGESCACPTPDAPTRPAVVLDPFCGTGTTVMAASALGRYGIGIDLSRDYLRVAEWRVNDPKGRAKVLQVDPPPAQIQGQQCLL